MLALVALRVFSLLNYVSIGWKRHFREKNHGPKRSSQSARAKAFGPNSKLFWCVGDVMYSIICAIFLRKAYNIFDDAVFWRYWIVLPPFEYLCYGARPCFWIQCLEFLVHDFMFRIWFLYKREVSYWIAKHCHLTFSVRVSMMGEWMYDAVFWRYSIVFLRFEYWCYGARSCFPTQCLKFLVQDLVFRIWFVYKCEIGYWIATQCHLTFSVRVSIIGEWMYCDWLR